MRNGSGIEERRHQAELIVLAAVTKPRIILKCVPNGSQAFYVLAHLSDRILPFFAERAFAMRPRLRAQTQRKSALGLARKIPGDLRAYHWASWKSKRLLRAKWDAGRLFGGECQQEERIMGGFRNPGAVESKLLRPLYLCHIVKRIAGRHDGCINLQSAVFPICSLTESSSLRIS